MINIIKSFLYNEEIRILEQKGGYMIWRSKTNDHYPEDYIEVKFLNDLIQINEVHRNDRYLVAETKDEVLGGIYTSVIYLRWYHTLPDDNNDEKIREYIEKGEEQKAIEMLSRIFGTNYYTIGKDNLKKLSLIKKSDGVDIKYYNNYLVQDASLGRAYAALYNYCVELSFIYEFYCNKINQCYYNIDFENVARIYILGKLTY